MAAELDPAARAAAWEAIVAQAPAAGEFQDRTPRTIPVFSLTRSDNPLSEDQCATC